MQKLPRIHKQTKRLTIRPLELFDYENWAQARSSMHPPQNEWDDTNWKESELTLKKFKELLKKNKTDRMDDHFYEMGIFRNDDGMLIGRISLMDISRGIFQNAYLGYSIFNPFWSQGYATEACKAVLQIAFKELNLHRVEAGIAPTNKSSIKVAKKIGLRKESLSNKRLFVRNNWTDVQLWAATCEDFRIKYKFRK